MFFEFHCADNVYDFILVNIFYINLLYLFSCRFGKPFAVHNVNLWFNIMCYILGWYPVLPCHIGPICYILLGQLFVCLLGYIMYKIHHKKTQFNFERYNHVNTKLIVLCVSAMVSTYCIHDLNILIPYLEVFCSVCTIILEVVEVLVI